MISGSLKNNTLVTLSGANSFPKEKIHFKSQTWIKIKNATLEKTLPQHNLFMGD